MMQRKFIYTVIIAIAFLSMVNSISAQSEVKKWSFQTSGRIESSIQVSNDTLYVGSLDSNFYALDTLGGLIWKTKIPYQIRSTASFSGNNVYFEAGNRLYALKKTTGELAWKHEPTEVVGKDVIQSYDSWDMKGPSPLLKEETLYYGNQFGSVYGVNALTGNQEFHFNTDTTFAVRTKPAIVNDTIYVADLDGYIYAASISTSQLLWSYHTYSGPRPYPPFGPIIGEMVVHDGLLMCGIRNHDFQVFNRKTGELAWNLVHGNTWLSGIPQVVNDTLYLGTSDTHELVALNVTTGAIFWQADVNLGLYNKPIFYNDLIIVATGEEQMRTENGDGQVVLINKSGEMVNTVNIGASCFNSPAIRNNDLYLGTYRGEIACYDLSALTTDLKDSISSDIVAYSGVIITESSLYTEELGYIRNVGSDTVMLDISMEDTGLPDAAISFNIKKLIHVNDSSLLKLQIRTSLLDNSDYQTKILVDVPENPALNFEIPVSFSIDINTSNTHTMQGSSPVKVFPNPTWEIATIELNANEPGEGKIVFFDINGKSLETIPVFIASAGKYTFQWEVETNSMAHYQVIFNEKQIDSGTLIIQ